MLELVDDCLTCLLLATKIRSMYRIVYVVPCPLGLCVSHCLLPYRSTWRLCVSHCLCSAWRLYVSPCLCCTISIEALCITLSMFYTCSCRLSVSPCLCYTMSMEPLRITLSMFYTSSWRLNVSPCLSSTMSMEPLCITLSMFYTSSWRLNVSPCRCFTMYTKPLCITLFMFYTRSWGLCVSPCLCSTTPIEAVCFMLSMFYSPIDAASYMLSVFYHSHEDCMQHVVVLHVHSSSLCHQVSVIRSLWRLHVSPCLYSTRPMKAARIALSVFYTCSWRLYVSCHLVYLPPYPSRLFVLPCLCSTTSTEALSHCLCSTVPMQAVCITLSMFYNEHGGSMYHLVYVLPGHGGSMYHLVYVLPCP